MMPRLLTVLLFLCLVGGVVAQTGRRMTEPVVVAYVFPRSTALQPGEIAARKLTRINYAFANIEAGRMVNGFSAEDENLAYLVALKQQNPSLTVLVSVGGWEWSGGFSDVALTTKSRAIFIASVMDYLDRHKLDGLDIDWEYPGQAGSTNHFRPEDKQNFTLLLKELRERFDREQKTIHRRLFLTIAAGASSSYLEHTEMRKVQKYVDTVNLMAYDYYEPGVDATTGNHAPLFTNRADPKRVSANESIRLFEAAGVPAAKLVLGVPFYGHVWDEVSDVNHGLFQPGRAAAQTYLQYGDLAATMLDKSFERHWDSAACVPYLYSPERKTFISYEDAESLTQKSRYVLEHKLGGMMFWDYAGDPSGVLLDAIRAGLSRPLEKPFKACEVQ
jgi:chitinase